METILITGSTRGIGYCIASYLVNNYRVIFHGSCENSLEKIREEFKDNENVYFLSFNLLEDSPETLIDRAFELLGITDIGVLVNNCAIATRGEETDDTIQLNFMVPYKLTKYAIKRGISKIINMSSLGAIVYDADLSDYCLSKACIENMTTHLAYSHRDTVITCIRVDGTFKTKMSQSLYPDMYETFDEPSAILPLFLTVLRMGKECSGKVYSYRKSRINLRSETQLRSNYLSKDILEFPENVEGKHVCNGENKFAGNEGLYPDSESVLRLTAEISKISGISSENIVINHGGISSAFDTLCSQFINYGDEVICHTLCFQPMILSVTNRGGILKTIQPTFQKYKASKGVQLTYSLEKIPSLITPATRMIFLVHPTYLFNDVFEPKIFREILAKIPKNIPIILDECYYEYFSETDILHSGELVDDHLIFGLRTFSKMYGLATIRLGYVICPSRYKSFVQSGYPFKDIPKQSLDIAYENLKDGTYLESHMKFVKERDEFQRILKENDIQFWGSSTIQVICIDPQHKQRIQERVSDKSIVLPDVNLSDELIMYTLGDNLQNKMFLECIL